MVLGQRRLRIEHEAVHDFVVYDTWGIFLFLS